MAVSVYRIYTYSEGSNAYGVSRQERWELKEVDIKFDTIDDAKQYIREQSQQYTSLPNYMLQWRETKPEDRTKRLEDVIDEFCFTNDLYWKERRFLLNPADLKRMKNALQNEGISVVK